MSWIDTQDPEAVRVSLASQRASVEGRAWTAYHLGDECYALWMLLVDARYRHRTGLSVHDMEDFAWRDLYDQDFSPREAEESFALLMLEGAFGDA